MHREQTVSRSSQEDIVREFFAVGVAAEGVFDGVDAAVKDRDFSAEKFKTVVRERFIEQVKAHQGAPVSEEDEAAMQALLEQMAAEGLRQEVQDVAVLGVAGPADVPLEDRGQREAAADLANEGLVGLTMAESWARLPAPITTEPCGRV